MGLVFLLVLLYWVFKCVGKYCLPLDLVDEAGAEKT